MEAIEKELDMIAKYNDQVETLEKYIDQDPLKPNV